MILTVDAYLVRRRNIFAIIGKDENNPEDIQSFNSEYFEQLNCIEEVTEISDG